MTDFDNTIIDSEREGDVTTAGPAEGYSPEMRRREFLKRFGVYTAGSTVGLYVLMSGRTSALAASDGEPANVQADSQDSAPAAMQYRDLYKGK